RVGILDVGVLARGVEFLDLRRDLLIRAQGELDRPVVQRMEKLGRFVGRLRQGRPGDQCSEKAQANGTGANVESHLKRSMLSGSARRDMRGGPDRQVQVAGCPLVTTAIPSYPRRWRPRAPRPPASRATADPGGWCPDPGRQGRSCWR